ncbi:hypothetical protein ACJX0J_019685, partial [Zea mays]
WQNTGDYLLILANAFPQGLVLLMHGQASWTQLSTSWIWPCCALRGLLMLIDRTSWTRYSGAHSHGFSILVPILGLSMLITRSSWTRSELSPIINDDCLWHTKSGHAPCREQTHLQVHEPVLQRIDNLNIMRDTWSLFFPNINKETTQVEALLKHVTHLNVHSHIISFLAKYQKHTFGCAQLIARRHGIDPLFIGVGLYMVTTDITPSQFGDKGLNYKKIRTTARLEMKELGYFSDK